MNNKGESTGWIKIVITEVVIALITSFFMLIISSINRDDVNVFVMDSVSVDGQYYTTVSVEDMKKNVLEDITLQLNRENEIISLFGEGETIRLDDAKIIIDYLYPDEKISFVIISEKAINRNEMFWVENKREINITYNKSKQEIFLTNFIVVIFVIVIFSIMNIINHISLDKKRKKTVFEMKIKSDELEKEFEELNIINKDLSERSEELTRRNKKLNKKLNDLEKKFDKYTIKQKIYYLNRINDYKKEIGFWRNTVRKLLYNSKESKSNVDKVIEVITRELKTYTTRENETILNDECYEIFEQLKDDINI